MANSKLTALAAASTLVGTEVLYGVQSATDVQITASQILNTTGSNISVGVNQTIGFSTDVLLARDAANILAQRNGTSGQICRIYQTYTNASNGAWAELDLTTANTAKLAIKGNGTGVATMSKFQITVNGANTVDFGISNGASWTFTSSVTLSAGNIIVSGGGIFTSVGNIVSAGALQSSSPTSGIGYWPTSGGAVSQVTSKSTGVTLNKVTGKITMDAAALAAGTTVGFTLTSSAIALNDTVVVVIQSGASTNSYSVQVSAVTAGSCRIEIQNTTSATSLSEALVLMYTVIKGQIA